MTEVQLWSDPARSQLITAGRRLAEAVLVHIEKLERLSSDDDLDSAEASTLDLGRALDKFEDVQLAYCGLGLPYLDLSDTGIYVELDDTELPDTDLDDDTEWGDDEFGEVRQATDVRHISVLSRIDLTVDDHAALRQAATVAGHELGLGEPDHLGESLYNVTALGGIEQLLQTNGITPATVLTVFTEQPDPMEIDDLEESDLVDLFDLEDAAVLLASSDVWQAADPETN